MNNNITNREDVFLAKIAGRDVDISTMTPPVVSSTREQLLSEIAERVDNIESGSGGGGSGYVPFVITYDADGFNKTYAEIVAAKATGNPIYLIDEVNYGDDGVPYPIYSATDTGEGIIVRFYDPADGLYMYTMDENGNVERTHL